MEVRGIRTKRVVWMGVRGFIRTEGCVDGGEGYTCKERGLLMGVRGYTYVEAYECMRENCLFRNCLLASKEPSVTAGKTGTKQWLSELGH